MTDDFEMQMSMSRHKLLRAARDFGKLVPFATARDGLLGIGLHMHDRDAVIKAAQTLHPVIVAGKMAEAVLAEYGIEMMMVDSNRQPRTYDEAMRARDDLDVLGPLVIAVREVIQRTYGLLRPDEGELHIVKTDATH